MTEKPSAEAILKSLTESGVVNPKTTIEDLLKATSRARAGQSTEGTVVYDDDKYFAVIK